jgi:hypothetical protein
MPSITLPVETPPPSYAYVFGQAQSVDTYNLQRKLSNSSSAEVWAEEFMKVKDSFAAEGRILSREDERMWVLTWFANAIETGRSFGTESGRNIAAVAVMPYIDQARVDGFSTGYNKGYDDGFADGKMD